MQNNFIKIALSFVFLISLFITGFILKIFDIDISDSLFDILQGNVDSLITPIIVLVIVNIILFTGIFFIYKKYADKSFLPKKERKLGSSKFSSVKEMKSVTGEDGLILGEKIRLSMNHSFSHYGLVGVTGSGKSSSFFIPNLVSSPNTSSIVTDPKGELFEKTAKENIKQGKKVLVFSPFQEDTLKYNPLTLCESYTEIRELAQSLLVNGNASVEAITGQKGGGSEWINMSVPLLSAFLIFVKDLPAPKNTIPFALDLIIENDIDVLEYLLEDGDEVALKQFNIFMQSAKSEETAASIKTILSSNLQMFSDPMIVNLISDNEINPEVLRKQPTVLYVVVPEQKSDYMSPLMASFYYQMIGKLMEIPGVPINMFLDEFANIGVINGIEKYLAVVRSRKISISIGIQSLSQLYQRYGKEATGTILDNLKTKAVLPGSSYETAEYFSKMIGNEEVGATSTNFDSGHKSASYSRNKQKNELMPPDEIRRLGDGKILILTDNKNPFIDKQERYYLKQEYINKTKDEMDINEYISYFRKNKTS